MSKSHQSHIYLIGAIPLCYINIKVFIPQQNKFNVSK